jgi:hypothetical protein
VANTSNRKNSNNGQSPDDEWIGELIWTLIKATGHLLWWAVMFPTISVPIIACAVVGIARSGKTALISGTVISAAYAAWAWVDATSFHAWVVAPVRRRWLTWWRYTRSWEAVCTLHGLTTKLCERTLVPRLRSVTIGVHTDVLELRVVSGQSINDWQKQADALAAAWSADIKIGRKDEMRLAMTFTCWVSQHLCPRISTRDRAMFAATTPATLGRKNCAVLAATSAALHGVMLGHAASPAMGVLMAGMALACLYCARDLWMRGTLQAWVVVALMNLAMLALHLPPPAHHHAGTATAGQQSTIMALATTLSLVEVGLAAAVLWFRTRRAAQLVIYKPDR